MSASIKYIQYISIYIYMIHGSESEFDRYLTLQSYMDSPRRRAAWKNIVSKANTPQLGQFCLGNPPLALGQEWEIMGFLGMRYATQYGVVYWKDHT